MGTCEHVSPYGVIVKLIKTEIQREDGISVSLCFVSLDGEKNKCQSQDGEKGANNKSIKS